jgi:hypothetical protein
MATKGWPGTLTRAKSAAQGGTLFPNGFITGNKAPAGQG